MSIQGTLIATLLGVLVTLTTFVVFGLVALTLIQSVMIPGMSDHAGLAIVAMIYLSTLPVSLAAGFFGAIAYLWLSRREGSLTLWPFAVAIVSTGMIWSLVTTRYDPWWMAMVAAGFALCGAGMGKAVMLAARRQREI